MAGYYSSPLPLSSSPPGFAARVLINTAALARCQVRLSKPQLFQQFVPRRCQPLNQLRAAEAASPPGGRHGANASEWLALGIRKERTSTLKVVESNSGPGRYEHQHRKTS